MTENKPNTPDENVALDVTANVPPAGSAVPSLTDLGWNEVIEGWRAEVDPEKSLEPGRIAQVSRGFSLVFVSDAALLCESDRTEHIENPATGDFVLVDKGSELGPTITHLYPRHSALLRRAPGRVPRPQVLAANHEFVFVFHGLDRDLNVRRIERQLVLGSQTGTEPVIVLTKLDVVDSAETEQVVATLKNLTNATVVACSAVTGEGLDQLKPFYQKGKTAVLMGLSGVGKSTLVNAISDGAVQRTGEVRATDHKGRHTTVTRDLIPIPDAGCVIDTPGIREMGLWQSYTALAETFPEISDAASQCKFNDCQHLDEPDCAVQQALADEAITAERLEHWQELVDELSLQEKQLKEHDQKAESKTGAESRRRRDGERSTRDRRLKKKSKRK